MAYNEKLADRVRESLNELPGIEEKKMFRGITFMVNGKMCVSVGDNELILRINPTIQKDVLSRKGCQVMIMMAGNIKGTFW
jgi:TfoX/Sxy family transcriptional regulator of competence genes